MNVVVFWLIVGGVLLYAAFWALSLLWEMSVAALRVVGAAADATTQQISNAQVQMRGRLARRIGRANEGGEEVEVFSPCLPVAHRVNFTAAELNQCKDELRHQVPVAAVREISVPTFLPVEDVLALPELFVTVGSDSTLSESHIPTLLNNRSEGCSVPETLERQITPGELHVPNWYPKDEFPAKPELALPKLGASEPIALTLPLYQVSDDASWLRRWIVKRLNHVVRAVHIERISEFENVKADSQEKFLQLAERKRTHDCALAAWQEERAIYEVQQEALRRKYEIGAEEARRVYRGRRERYEDEFDAASQRLGAFWLRVKKRESASIQRLFNIAFARIVAPQCFPREWSIEIDSDQGILVLDLRLPDFERIQITRQVALRWETKTKPVKAKEQKQLAEAASCLYVLRVIHELLQQDRYRVAKAIALNGWVEFVDATTGRDRSVVILSIFAETDQLRAIDIARVDPSKCIASLGGRFAGIEHGYVPIAPIVRLNRHDDRVIEGADVLSGLAEGTNLAAMEWDKFEHLIRQLFEKVFAGPEIEVKVTRASRDRGVDAIIFDPDPIRGGKTVIQAKRYVNTVDLSAVRDLYGTVVNEGANKGILVTTSSFGPDAYEFSKDKNLTLLTGRELLGLLEKHGYRYRIDLEEARRLHAT